MRAIFHALAAAALTAAAPVCAQGESGGHPDLTARAANFIDGLAVVNERDRLQRGVCKTTGCLFIVNRWTDRDIVELRFDTIAPGASHEPVWSNNALRSPIRPQRTAGLIKFGDKTLCGLPARLVLKGRHGALEEVRGVMNLCTEPGIDVFSVAPQTAEQTSR